MAGLTATFKLVDEMSDKLSNIASGGQEMVSKFEEMGNIADNFFSQINDGSESTAKAVEEISSSFKGYENSVRSAADSTGYWTEAVGNYDKSALEAIYTTEDLVDMGLKTADALIEEGKMLGVCETAAASLSKEMETSIDVQSELNSIMETAIEVIKEVSENESVSAEIKRELANASEEAARAIEELEAAETAAKEAMDNYDNVIISGTTDIKKLNEAAKTASQAAEKLSEANKKAGEATEDLGKASKEAGEECEKAGKSGNNAFESMAEALAAAGITALIKDISSAAYELADAFSEAESTVVKATGASGEALDELNASMMEAYATAKSGSGLDDVSGAIGEISTRMGLTGDKLTEVTGQFLDFSNITGTDVVGSVQNVTKIMNKWGVEGENVESVLDKLSYAGQVSGISVDTLSSNLISGAAIFQEAGLSLDNAVSMLADFELAGINGATAITAMRTAVKNFSEDGRDAETALASVINEIANMENAADATALAVEIFGSRAGIDMANAIKKGVITVDSFTGNLEKASGTLEKTAENSQTLGQKWQQASNSIKTAFTTALQPAIDKMSSKFADIMNDIGDFLNEHPEIVKAVTAIGVGLGVVATGIAGVSFTTKVAIPLIKSFGTTFNAALGPIGWAVLAITSLISIVEAFNVLFDDTVDEMEGMTASTREEYQELQKLNAEYENICATQGKYSDEAYNLKYQIDTLSEAYKENKQTVEEFNNEIEANRKSLEDSAKEYKKTMREIDNNGVSTLALINRLEKLSLSTDVTKESQKEMETIIKKLNGSIDGLNLSYLDLQKNQKGTFFSLKDLAKQRVEEEKRKERLERYTYLMKAEEKSAYNLNIALKEQEAAERELLRLKQEFEHPENYDKVDISSFTSDYTNRIEEAETVLEEKKKKVEYVQSTIDLGNLMKAALEAEDESIRKAAEEAKYTVLGYDDAILKSTNNVKPAMEELVDEYQKVYEAARSSLDSQYSLFEKIEVKAGISSAKIIETLKQQEKVFNNYNENLKELEEHNINTEFLKELSDGSAESMGRVAALKQELSGLSSEEVAKRVDEINTSFGKLREAKDKTAITMADIQDDFRKKLDDIETDLENTIEKMNMGPESKEAAKKTMQGYIDGIYSMRNQAISAADSVAIATSAALSAGKGGNVMNQLELKLKELKELNLLEHNARGTTDAADVFIAGEEGPELVVGAGGSTVFPADHTERILSAINDRNFREKPLQVDVPQSVMSVGGDKNYNYSETKSEKKISIDINGNGSVSVNGPIDKESTVNFLYDNIKPVLLSILRTEIYEEGNESYVY